MKVTADEYKQLKKAYENAKNEGKETFIFLGMTLLTDYAKYLIEFLKGKYEHIDIK